MQLRPFETTPQPKTRSLWFKIPKKVVHKTVPIRRRRRAFKHCQQNLRNYAISFVVHPLTHQVHVETQPLQTRKQFNKF